MTRQIKLEQQLENIHEHIKELSNKMMGEGVTYDEQQLLQHYRRQYHRVENLYIESQRLKKERQKKRTIILPNDYMDWIRRYNDGGVI